MFPLCEQASAASGVYVLYPPDPRGQVDTIMSWIAVVIYTSYTLMFLLWRAHLTDLESLRSIVSATISSGSKRALYKAVFRDSVSHQ